MRWTSVVVLGAAVTGQAAAQFAGATLMGFGGRCHHLSVFGRELSARCDDRLVSLRLPDGRNGYVFSTVDHALIAFTAPAAGAALDRVTIVTNGKADTMAANGSCTTDDPTILNSSIACDAVTDRGQFRTEFSSDGGAGVRMAP